MNEALGDALIVDPLTPAAVEAARSADTELNQLLTRFMDCATLVAKAIHRIRSQELYRALGYETFEAYLRSKELRFSRSFVYQLAKVGEVMERSGVDPEESPILQELQISKLAQIARLPSPEEQRRVLTTGRFEVTGADGSREEQPLNDIPLRVISAELDDRLGIERPARRHAVDEPAMLMADGAVAEAAIAREAIFGGSRSEPVVDAGWSEFAPIPAQSGWRETLSQLAFQLQALPRAERQEAVTEVTAVLTGLVSEEIPF